MTDPLRGSLAIAVATCRELVRQPAYAALVILTLVAYSLAPQLASFALLGERSLLADFGVSMLLVSSWLLVAFGASSVVRREIESRTTLTVLSTPVTRFGFVAGKFLEPYTAEVHYQPARYHLSGFRAGHPPSYSALELRDR